MRKKQTSTLLGIVGIIYSQSYDTYVYLLCKYHGVVEMEFLRERCHEEETKPKPKANCCPAEESLLSSLFREDPRGSGLATLW